MSAPKYMAVQGAAMIVAAGLMAIGLLGFVPGVTTNYDQLTLAGQRSGAGVMVLLAITLAGQRDPTKRRSRMRTAA